MTEKAKEPLTFVYSTYIKTTPEKLWDALTSGDASEKYWSGFRIGSDWKVDSAVTVRNPDFLNGGGDLEGKLLEYDPPKQLRYTFDGPSPGFQGRANGPSVVTYRLEPVGDVVKLTIIHENLLPMDVVDAPNTLRGVNNGWPAIMSSLKSLLETGKELTYEPLWKEFD
jgi:uncharacterized protein YndB with AHSA1/START domain